ncbi:MAG TPA: OsmC family protein [Steroidobacteraceae bacterium]|nr:OsmC family protein [Steroidobacteraceae bacterium]
MTTEAIAKSMVRARATFARRPQAATHPDDPATARWEHGTRVVTRHPEGMRFATDMPTTLGGSGDQVTPGWLLRAALASCLATRIAMSAAEEGVALASLEVFATSTSDARGFLGMAEHAGQRVRAAPRCIQLDVRIGASGVPPARLRALVEESSACSPVSDALGAGVSLALNVEVAPS